MHSESLPLNDHENCIDIGYLINSISGKTRNKNDDAVVEVQFYSYTETLNVCNLSGSFLLAV